MSLMPDSAPRPLGGRHAMPDPRPVVVDGDAVTDRVFVPEQYRRPATPMVGAALVPQAGGGLARAGTPGRAMTRRHPVAVWLGLPLITLGVYTYVWYYKIHREMAEFDRRRVAPVAGPMLVLLLLGWTIVAPLVSLHNTGNRIADAQRAAGLRPTCSAGLGLLLCFAFGLVSLYYQSELNKIVAAYAVPAGTGIALRG